MRGALQVVQSQLAPDHCPIKDMHDIICGIRRITNMEDSPNPQGSEHQPRAIKDNSGIIRNGITKVQNITVF